MALPTRRIDRRTSRHFTRRAFTLAEALIASVVLAISVVGVAGTLASSSSQTDSTNESTIMTLLGRQLIEEIAAKPFPITGVTTAPGWSLGTRTRSGYDDAADYDGYADTTPVTTLAGDTINPGGTYRRSVTFTRRTAVSASPGNGDFGLITVTITAPTGATAVFSRLLTNINAIR